MDPLIIPVAASLLISIATSLFLYMQLKKLTDRFEKVTRGVKGKDLVELVSKFSEEQKLLERDISVIHSEFEKIRTDTKTFFRKVAVVRYQGFNDTGGNQSFSIALLDETNTGFILTSLYGRDFCKNYAKQIVNGSSAHTLTEEEQEALHQAIKK